MSCRNPYVDLTVCEASGDTIVFLEPERDFTALPVSNTQTGALPTLTLNLMDTSQWCVTLLPSLQIEVPPWVTKDLTLRSYAKVTLTVTVKTPVDTIYTYSKAITVESRSVSSEVLGVNFYELSPSWDLPTELSRGIYSVQTNVTVLYGLNKNPSLTIFGTIGAVASVAKILS